MFRYLVVFLFPLISFSQTITGSVKNKEEKAIYGASIIITKINSEEIIAYDITDANGHYSIKINLLDKQLKITVRVLGYKKENKLIDNKGQIINFILVPKITKLKEVIVKADKITKRRDTINYRVSSFANKKDRTIADVLSKMPGIEVLSNGKILYQGKPINRYYIEGLDLLEGRYNLANKNLPHNQVAKVQILENHQPIKILDSLVYSDKAALNIKLKNNVSFTGQAELGAGMIPLLWENNITPMLFSKKSQMISSYQTNNTGNDISSQIKTLTLDDLNGDIDNNNQKKDWLSIQKIRLPDFSKRRWLDNNIHVVSLNYLHKMKSNTNLRLNISYLNDYLKQKGNTNTLFFINRDTIKVFENKFNRLFNNSLDVNLALEKNSTNNYLKNKLTYKSFWDSEKGLIITNNSSIFQNLKNQYFTVSNKLQNIFSLKKQLITFDSFTYYSKTPQDLTITPGQFKELLNNENDFDRLKQQIDLDKIYINNSISFTRGVGSFTIVPKLGFQLENQNLSSDINIDNIELFNNDFRNNLDWFRGKTYFSFKTQFRKNNWRLELNMPLNFNHFNIKDDLLEKKEELNQLTFDPKLSLVNEINSFWKMSSSIAITNSFGKINNIHYGYILKNYRNIQRINSSIPKTFSQNYNLGFSYRNQLKSLFGSVFYSYSKSKENLLFNAKISSNGNVELQAIEKNNNKISHTFFGEISKYISSVKTSFTFNTSFSNYNYVQFLNDELTEINTKNNVLSLKTNTDITSWFDIEYKTIWNRSKSKIGSNENRSINNQSHLLDFNFYPKKNQFLGLKSEFVKNDLFSKKNIYFFTDLIYRFTLVKKKIDFELLYNNIFETENYQTININNYSAVETNFTLRPSQIIFKVRFSL